MPDFVVRITINPNSMTWLYHDSCWVV